VINDQKKMQSLWVNKALLLGHSYIDKLDLYLSFGGDIADNKPPDFRYEQT